MSYLTRSERAECVRKLSEADVWNIYHLRFVEGKTVRQISRVYLVSVESIRRALRGETYRGLFEKWESGRGNSLPPGDLPQPGSEIGDEEILASLNRLKEMGVVPVKGGNESGDAGSNL